MIEKLRLDEAPLGRPEPKQGGEPDVFHQLRLHEVKGELADQAPARLVIERWLCPPSTASRMVVNASIYLDRLALQLLHTALGEILGAPRLAEMPAVDQVIEEHREDPEPREMWDDRAAEMWKVDSLITQGHSLRMGAVRDRVLDDDARATLLFLEAISRTLVLQLREQVAL